MHTFISNNIFCYFLGERFYIRYLIGVLICILGSSIIVFNDKKPQSRTTILDDNLFMGIIVAISQLIFLALNFTGQKFMVKEKMENNVQNFYLGIIILYQHLYYA